MSMSRVWSASLSSATSWKNMPNPTTIGAAVGSGRAIEYAPASGHLAAELFPYYNGVGLHSGIGYCSPVDYEARA
jgi:hypothetical protein